MNEQELFMPVTANPFDHQRKAYDFVCGMFGLKDDEKTGGGAALLMEMGCGKSLVGLGVMGILSLLGRIDRALIVCPLSIISVWEEELKKFAGFPYQLTKLDGSILKKRSRLASVPRNGLQIVLVNYESMWRLEKELLAFHAGLIIADEGHRLKDGCSRQSKAMHRLGDQAAYRLLLTGTAITNKELDIYSEYRFVTPEVFGKNFYAFRNHFFIMGGYGGHVPIFRKELSNEFLEKLHSVAYRVRKDECLDLPATTDEVRTVDLEDQAMKLYEQIAENSYRNLKKTEGDSVNILTRILWLSEITGGHLMYAGHEAQTVSTAKMKALEDIVDTMQAENRKLVIMARFVPELDDIEAMLKKKHIGYACIRGGVKDRAEEVRRFQEDDDCTVFVGQIQAAGLGLTLTAASTMVFYSLDYNMANFDQARARIHRAFQQEKCHYIYLCCRNTIDFKTLKSLKLKRNLATWLMDEYRKGKNPFAVDQWDMDSLSRGFNMNPWLITRL